VSYFEVTVSQREVQENSIANKLLRLSITCSDQPHIIDKNYVKLNKNILYNVYQKRKKWTLNVEFFKSSGQTNSFVFL
jgi:hypothetical protein